MVRFKKIQLVFMAIAVFACTGCNGEPAKFNPKVDSMRSISGTVSGASVFGVSIALTGNAVRTVVTDSVGAYSISGVTDGSYTVTPTQAGYIFTPSSLSVPLAGADIANTDFAAVKAYEVSGQVIGAIQQGVSMTLTGVTNAVTTTDAGGNYKFTNVADESFIVTPSLDGYQFFPKSATAMYLGLDASIIYFAAVPLTASTFSISGTVSGDVQQGVGIKLTGTTCGVVMTDANGNYLFDGLTAGTYSVEPICANTTPSVSAVTITTANVSNVNFSLTSLGCSGSVLKQRLVSGTVSGVAQQDVVMILTGNNCALATTDVNGQYMFVQYLRGIGNYTITPYMVGHSFSPASTPITISASDLTGINFTSW